MPLSNLRIGDESFLRIPRRLKEAGLLFPVYLKVTT